MRKLEKVGTVVVRMLSIVEIILPERKIKAIIPFHLFMTLRNKIIRCILPIAIHILIRGCRDMWRSWRKNIPKWFIEGGLGNP